MPSGRKRECEMLGAMDLADVKRQRRSTTPSTPTLALRSANNQDVSPLGESPPLSPQRPRRLAQEEPFSDQDDTDYIPPALPPHGIEEKDLFLAFSGSMEESPEGKGKMIPGQGEEEMTWKADLSTMTPDNILTPWPELKAFLESTPCRKCLGKRRDAEADEQNIFLWKPSLEAKLVPWGAISDIIVKCNNCGYEGVICPSITLSPEEGAAAAPPARTGNNNNTQRSPTRRSAKPYNVNDSKFRKYPINYQLVLLVQHLGCGLDSIDSIFAHLGMLPSKGGWNRWKYLQDAIGQAEQSVAKEVFKENIQGVINFHEARADSLLVDFEGTDDEKQAKRTEILHLKAGKIGIPVGMDGAWQKRAIGFGSYNSFSGMNFCVELNTKKIINLVVYSKQCTYCTRWRSRHPAGAPVPEHRCSQNYDPSDSSKSMEADASCLHKEDVELAPDSKVHIDTLCTDDDSTVRANTKYSLKAYFDNLHGHGNWRKSDVAWPYTIRVDKNGKETRVYAKDNGHLNLQCFPIDKYITDINHRVRVIAKGLFGIRSEAKTIPPGKLAKEECHRLKSITSLYLKDARNRELPFEEFCRRAPCMYLHHFNDHSCCDVSWCKKLQSQRSDGVEPTVLSEAYQQRFRDKTLDWVTFKAVEDIFAPYLTQSALQQCYHGQDTNKNESLNRKCSATAPKDRYFSGSMSLSDRFHLVVVIDSYGYVVAYRRILKKIGVNLKLTTAVLEEWCRRKDNDQSNRVVHMNRPDVKSKRQAATKAKVKAWIVGERNATKTGRDYATGTAVAAVAQPMEDPHWKKVDTRNDMTLAELPDDTSLSVGTRSTGDNQFAIL